MDSKLKPGDYVIAIDGSSDVPLGRVFAVKSVHYEKNKANSYMLLHGEPVHDRWILPGNKGTIFAHLKDITPLEKIIYGP